MEVVFAPASPDAASPSSAADALTEHQPVEPPAEVGLPTPTLPPVEATPPGPPSPPVEARPPPPPPPVEATPPLPQPPLEVARPVAQSPPPVEVTPPTPKPPATATPVVARLPPGPPRAAKQTSRAVAKPAGPATPAGAPSAIVAAAPNAALGGPALVAARPIAGLAANQRPAYPPAALRRREAGDVVVRVAVGADGHPLSARIEQSSGYKLLDEAALDKVLRDWRFMPATQNGVPVAGSALVPFSFQIEN